MIRLYPLVILIQIFCLYHAYKNKSEQRWFWIIIVFPFLGSLFYLYDQFYSRGNIDKIKEEVKGSIISNYTINKLEQKVVFSDTFSNRLELANEHFKIGNYDRAIQLYESSNIGANKNDSVLLMKLIQAHYMKKHYKMVLEYGELLDGKKEFINSQERAAVAWSYYYEGDIEAAEKIFFKMDTNFSNYDIRLDYVYFLQKTKGNFHAKIKAEELLDEIEDMDAYEKRLNKNIIKDIKYCHSQLYV